MKEIDMKVHRRWFLLGVLCLFAASAPIKSFGQTPTFPSRPVKFITPQAAGSGNDPAMRVLADKLGKMWGQQIALINQPGAGGAIAVRSAASAVPDGHILFITIASTLTVLPVTEPDLSEKLNSFVPIGFAGEIPMGIAVSPQLPVNSLAELIEFSKKQPAGLNAAVAFRGGMPDLATELFRNRTGANLNPIYYPGSVQAMSDVIADRVPIIVDGLSGPLGGGQVKLLAIASPARLPSHPQIPTVSETVPGFTASGWFVLLGPPGTPAWIAKKVNEDLRQALDQQDVREKFTALGVSTRAMSPEELSDFIGSEQQLWKPVISKVGLAAQ